MLILVVVLSSLTAMGVDVILGERLDLSSPPKEVVNEDGVLERVARTQSGREIQAGVVVCITHPELALKSHMPSYSCYARGKFPTRLLCALSFPRV